MEFTGSSIGFIVGDVPVRCEVLTEKANFATTIARNTTMYKWKTFLELSKFMDTAALRWLRHHSVGVYITAYLGRCAQYSRWKRAKDTDNFLAV
jgi:hypothetical protein